jgi:beta-lactam-binding protein with PASTA domain
MRRGRTVTEKVSTGKAGIVLSQNPKQATILTIGSKVAVVVSKT